MAGTMTVVYTVAFFAFFLGAALWLTMHSLDSEHHSPDVES